MSKTRDAIRSVLLGAESSRKYAKTIEFLGQEIEIRPVTVGRMRELMKHQDDPMKMLFLIALDSLYVPGTDEKVLEPSDEQAFYELRITPDFAKLRRALEEMFDIDVEEAEKN